MGFGENLRYYRGRRGLQAQQLAQMVHAKPSTFSQWETGKHMPHPEIMVLLAKALGVSMDELMEERPVSLPDLGSWKEEKNIGDAAIKIEEISEAHGLSDEETEALHLEAVKHFRLQFKKGGRGAYAAHVNGGSDDGRGLTRRKR